MFISTINSLGEKLVLFVLMFIGSNCLGQDQEPDAFRKLPKNIALISKSQSFYIKPIIEQYQSAVTVEGDGFSKPLGDLLRKRGFGVRLGYQWGLYELETGVSAIRPGAGYRYRVKGDIGTATQVRSTDYYQVPVVVRYRLWQIRNCLSLRAGVGVAYNIDIDKLSLAPNEIIQEGIIDVNQKPILLSRFTRTYTNVKSFFSGEVNASIQYKFLKRFNVTFEVRRLLSRKDVVQISAVQETFDPPTVRNVKAYGSVNSYNFNLGLAYQFMFLNRYSIK